MVLTHASPTRLVFTRRRSLGPTAYPALLLSIMGALPLLAPGTVGAWRLGMTATLLLLAAGLAALARPRSERLIVALDRGTLEAGPKTVPLTRVRFIQLSSTGSSEERSARSRYRAELVLEESTRWVLLERSDPAKVLLDLRKALAHWSLPVRSGWGLPDGADPWKDGPPRSSAKERVLEAHGVPFANERGAGICVLGGALVIGTAMGLMHGARMQRGAPTHALSWALSGTTLGLILLLAGFLLTDETSVRMDGNRLVLERRALGVRLFARELDAGSVRAIHCVGVDPAVPQHLLVDAGAELFAVPLTGEPARRVAQAFAR